MKTILSVLTCVALTLNALAIPQSIGNGGFFGAVGMHFEDFAGQAGAFGAGAEMKGKWAPVQKLGAKNGKVANPASGTEEMKLATDAVVFGIPATEIRAVKRENAVTEYVVQYSAAADLKRGKQNATLLARVLAGVSAYTGEKAESMKTIDRKGVKILVAVGGNGDVVVKFSH